MAGNLSGIAVAETITGFVLVWSGIKNQSLQNTLTSLLKGQNPTAIPGTPPTIGIGSSSSSSNSSSSSGSKGSSGSAPSNPAPGGSEAANQAIVKKMAAGYGWDTGAEWSALNNIIMAESGYNNTAQNPGSTAYGIFQFLDTTWATVGGSKTSNATLQTYYGLRYIKVRYGDPEKAWAFHLANGYY